MARLHGASNSSSPRCAGRETPSWLTSAECLLHSASSRDALEAEGGDNQRMAAAEAEHAAEVATAVAPQGRTGAASLHGQRLAAMHAAMAVLERSQADAVESRKDELRALTLPKTPYPYPNPNPNP